MNTVDINTDPPCVGYVKRAIENLKNGKAAGIDKINRHRSDKCRASEGRRILDPYHLDKHSTEDMGIRGTTNILEKQAVWLSYNKRRALKLQQI